MLLCIVYVVFAGVVVNNVFSVTLATQKKLWAQSCMTRMRDGRVGTLYIQFLFFFFFSKTVFNGIVFFFHFDTHAQTVRCPLAEKMTWCYYLFTVSRKS